MTFCACFESRLLNYFKSPKRSGIKPAGLRRSFSAKFQLRFLQSGVWKRGDRPRRHVFPLAPRLRVSMASPQRIDWDFKESLQSNHRLDLRGGASNCFSSWVHINANVPESKCTKLAFFYWDELQVGNIDQTLIHHVSKVEFQTEEFEWSEFLKCSASQKVQMQRKRPNYFRFNRFLYN